VDDAVGFFLAAYPVPIVDLARRLRSIVRRAQPDAIERLRSGWALVGYDIPLGRNKRYFAFIAPERRHIHLGFEYGAWMSDPDRILEGAHLKLKKVRFLTFEAGAELDRPALLRLTREAARVALLSRSERLALALDLTAPRMPPVLTRRSSS
jgi:hypothetical protein